MKYNYRRVIPRDLFNEAGLLRGLGLLALAIHDNKQGIGSILAMELFDEEDGFVMAQDESDGSLFVSNLICYPKEDPEESIFLYSRLNDRTKNLLQFKYDFLELEGAVFDGQEFSPEFQTLLNRIVLVPKS